MDWTTILNSGFTIMELASGCFLVYGGWICVRHVALDRPLPRKRTLPAPTHGLHSALAQ